jgi:ESS family glutamate:Na+ symporter
MNFTPWSLFLDVGIMSLLILAGVFLRAKIKLIQELFLPASLLAGLLGLVLGPNGLGYIPFSDQIGTYSGILIAVVFAGLSLTTPPIKFKEVFNRVGELWGFSMIAMILQWGLGALFGMFVLCKIWDGLNPAFGLMLASGFAGGHGTAAAIGAAFKEHGWEDAASLAMTSATVGIILAVVVGVILVKIGTMKGYTNFISDYKTLPQSLKTGILPEEERRPIGIERTSSISLDSLTLQISIIILISVGGYYLSKIVGSFFPKLSLPVFSCAFIAGIVLRLLMSSSHVTDLVDLQSVGRISGTCTDFLVAFGIASIKLPVVVKYATPLAILFGFGLLYCLFFFMCVGPRMLHSNWYEKSLFTWGWMTGTMAMGIALLRIADPRQESGSLDDFAFAYIPLAPVEILVVSLSPLMFSNGTGLYFIAACIGSGVAVFVFSLFNKWFTLTPAIKKSK